MTPVSAPLKLSAAGMRVAGYMLESNLRVAQVLGRAAFETNPFFGKLPVKVGRPPVRPDAAVTTQPAEPAAPAAAKLAAKAKAPPTPAKAGEAAVKPAPATETAVERTAQPAPGPATADAPAAPAKAEPEDKTAKRTRQPSPPPAMPGAARDGGPNNGA